MAATPSVYLSAVVAEFRRYKRMAEDAIEQVDDAGLVARLNAEQNSVFVIMQHVSGNLASRWADFLTTDGEKPTRDREREFAEPPGPVPRADALATWERGWRVLFDTLASLTDDDLTRTVHIRGEAMPAATALARSLAHTAYHVGQVVLLAKHHKLAAGGSWHYLTIAPGQSKQYNEGMGHRA